MKLNDFLKNNNHKKYLVCQKTSLANSLIRRYNLTTKMAVFNVESVTVNELAKRIYIAFEAKNNNYNCYELISNKEASFLFQLHLLNNKYDFIPDSCISLQSSISLFETINQVRKGKIIKDSDPKLIEIEQLVNDFESFLVSNRLFDDVLLYKKVCEIIDNNCVFDLLSINKDIDVGILENTTLTYLENKLLDKIVNRLNTKTIKIEYLEKQNIKEHFISNYGNYNEVENVIDLIINNNIAFGDVEVLYSSNEYENIIRGLCELRNIPFRFTTLAHGSSTNLIQFMIDVNNFIMNNYSYKLLEKIILNPIFSFENIIETDSIYNPINIYYDILNDNINERKERYYQYFERLLNCKVEYKDSNIEKYIPFVNFLKEIIELYDNKKLDEAYLSLIDFTFKYTILDNKEKLILKPYLDSQIKVFKIINISDLKTNCNYINDFLSNITYKESSDPGSISFSYFNDLKIIERNNLFVIGLSSISMIQKEIESALLEDDKIEQLLENVNNSLILAKENNKRYNEKLDLTIASLLKGNVYYFYSRYDTIQLRKSSPSVFYLDKLNSQDEIKLNYKYKDDDILISSDNFVNYYLNDTNTNKDDLIHEDDEVLLKHQDVNEDTIKTPKKAKFVYLLDTTNIKSFSPSGLSTLINCPFQYYYDKILKLPAPNFVELKPHQWLEANQKGTLFHRICELYCSKLLTKKTDLIRKFDKDLFESSYKQALDEAIFMQPIPENINIFNYEASKHHKEAYDYLNRFTNELNNDAKDNKYWIVIACEMPFGPYSKDLNGSPTIVKYDSKNDFSIMFNGFIDRVDGYVDDENILHLRVIDYKTGKYEKIKKKVNDNVNLQHIIYPLAANQYVKNNLEYIEKLFEHKIDKIVIDDAIYISPVEKVDLSCINMIRPLYSQVDNYTLKLESMPESVEEILILTEKERQQGSMLQALDNMNDYFNKYLKTSFPNDFDKESICEYCKYTHICCQKLKGETLNFKIDKKGVKL